MIEAVAERVRSSRGVCGYDICAFNNESMLNRGGTVSVERLDSQTYYVADLSAV